jgi:hypothetical protein
MRVYFRRIAHLANMSTALPMAAVSRGSEYNISRISRSSDRNSIPFFSVFQRNGYARRVLEPVAHHPRLMISEWCLPAFWKSSGGSPLWVGMSA